MNGISLQSACPGMTVSLDIVAMAVVAILRDSDSNAIASAVSFEPFGRARITDAYGGIFVSVGSGSFQIPAGEQERAAKWLADSQRFIESKEVGAPA